MIATAKPSGGLRAMAPVISARGLTILEHGLADLDAFLTKAPDLEPLRTKLQDAIARTGDKTLRLADLGFAPAHRRGR